MNNNNILIDAEFILKVLSNNATEEEIECLNRWIAQSDDNKKHFEEFKSLWNKLENIADVKIPNVGKEWNKVRDAIAASQQANSCYRLSENVYPAFMDKKYKSIWLLKIAAVVAMVFISYFAFKQISFNKVKLTEKKVLQEVCTFETKKGERATIKLSDNSTVYLNSASSLKYPKTFNGTYRTVELNGEAYFSVTSDMLKPFRVKVDSQIIEVVGTEFNIYNRNNNFRIVVTKGKVNAFKQDSNKIVAVAQGEMVQLSSHNDLTMPVKVNVNDYLGWRVNKLIFKDRPLDDVMKEVENYFSVDVKFKNDKLKKKLLSGSFKINRLDEIITAISISMNVDINRKGNTITISE